LVLQNPTRALAALVLDAGIATAKAKTMLGLQRMVPHACVATHGVWVLRWAVNKGPLF
jgi:hypothetical protein